ncbi:MAG: TetR/AcrR family transcriptional regulator [Clostridia bacterium]|nr:TetR/AcrR family transcriptional regulator [Clostridia bacterium]
MPPKEKLTRADIQQGALALLRESGYEGLNARALAERLGCSTMPLFRHFRNMEEIRLAAIASASEIYTGYIRRGSEQPVPFKGIGMEYIRFAKEEPRLFQLFFMTSHQKVPLLPSEDPNYADVSRIASVASGLLGEEGKRMYREMWIFVHGIATMVVTGVMDFCEKEIGEMLTDVFQGLRGRFQEPKKGETI